MKHRTFYFLRVFALFIGLGSVDLYAANIEFTCNIANGFNFQRDVQSTIGYITSLTIGTTTLAADLNVKDPTTLNATTAVGVLSYFSWNSAYNGPLSFRGQISIANKQTLALLLSKPLTNSQVQIEFKVFQYDPSKTTWFTALAPSTSAGLKGTIVSGAPPTVGAVPGTVKSPTNYYMSLQIAPQAIAQSMQYAIGAGTTVVMKWGTP